MDIYTDPQTSVCETGLNIIDRDNIVTVKEHRDKYQQLKLNALKLYDVRHCGPDVSLTMNRHIRIMGTSKAAIIPDNWKETKKDAVLQKVERFLRLDNPCTLNQFRLDFDFRIVAIGSVAENTKVLDANEYDFLLVLSPRNQLQLSLEPQAIPATGKTYNVKSACNVQVRNICYTMNNIPDCTYEAEDPTRTLMNPNAMYQYFEEFIETGLEKLCQSREMPEIKQSGPAFSFYLHNDNEFIKIDICLALEVHRSEVVKCLKANGSGLRLPSVEKIVWEDKCYVVCFRQFWKISVCNFEIQLFNYWGKFYSNLVTMYKALKVMFSYIFDRNKSPTLTLLLKTCTISGYPKCVMIMCLHFNTCFFFVQYLIILIQ